MRNIDGPGDTQQKKPACSYWGEGEADVPCSEGLDEEERDEEGDRDADDRIDNGWLSNSDSSYGRYDRDCGGEDLRKEGIRRKRGVGRLSQNS